MPQTIDYPALVDLLRRAYSGERAAAFAYIGHAGSLRCKETERDAVRQIEEEEWEHRRQVKQLMDLYEIAPSRWYELKFYLIGKVVGLSCYFIGRFMPYFFAGKLESGNVCEYFIMMHRFHEIGITSHDEILYEMGVKEKEHEVFFQKMIEDEPWLPMFERIFHWGPDTTTNDVDLESLKPVPESQSYCRNRPSK
jgi:hypothetical protein